MTSDPEWTMIRPTKAVDFGPARADLGFDPRSFAVGIRAEAALIR